MKDSDLPKTKSFAERMEMDNSQRCGSSGAFMINVTMELRKKILTLRDILDLPSCDGSASINKLAIGLMEDLKNLYPEITHFDQKLSDLNERSIEQVLDYFCESLKSIEHSWMANGEWIKKLDYDSTAFKENNNSYKLAEIAVKLLDCMIKMAGEKFDIMDEDDQMDYYISRINSFEKVLSNSDSDSNSSCRSSPVTPTSVLPELSTAVDSSKTEETANFSYTPPLLLSLRVQAVKKLNQIDLNYLRLHYSHERVICGGTTLDENADSGEEGKREKEVKKSLKRTHEKIREEGSDS